VVRARQGSLEGQHESNWSWTGRRAVPDQDPQGQEVSRLYVSADG